MKAEHAYRVPLSGRAAKVLAEAAVFGRSPAPQEVAFRLAVIESPRAASFRSAPRARLVPGEAAAAG